jgi:hypothetical protein
MPHALEERPIVAGTKTATHLYEDRSTQQWIVLDPEGNYWTVTLIENPWDHREPFHATNETELERVPSHYRHLVGLPF